MFEALNARIESESIQYLYRLEIGVEGLQTEEYEREQELIFAHPSGEGFEGGGESGGEAEIATATPVRRKTPKVGRNQPCTCGSGKKYKHCCGK
jgi:preprotein translocase subunit SecA